MSVLKRNQRSSRSRCGSIMQAPSSVAAGDPMADDKVTVGNNASALQKSLNGASTFESGSTASGL